MKGYGVFFINCSAINDSIIFGVIFSYLPGWGRRCIRILSRRIECKDVASIHHLIHEYGAHMSGAPEAFSEMIQLKIFIQVNLHQFACQQFPNRVNGNGKDSVSSIARTKASRYNTYYSFVTAG